MDYAALFIFYILTSLPNFPHNWDTFCTVLDNSCAVSLGAGPRVPTLPLCLVHQQSTSHNLRSLRVVQHPDIFRPCLWPGGCQDLCCPLRRTEQNNTAHVQAVFFSLALGFILPPWLLLLWFAPSWASALLKLHSSSVGPRLLLPWGKKCQKMALVAPLIYLFCFSEEIVPSSVWLCWF